MNDDKRGDGGDGVLMCLLTRPLRATVAAGGIGLYAITYSLPGHGERPWPGLPPHHPEIHQHVTAASTGTLIGPRAAGMMFATVTSSVSAVSLEDVLKGFTTTPRRASG
jgi:hypothetical protein